MNWFFIALGAPFLWALVNIADQYLVSKYSKGEHGSGALVLFSSLIGVITAIGIWIFTDGVFTIPILDKILLIITGVLGIVWVVLYLFALEIEEVSAVVPWFLTVPIFGYILGYIFLGETLTKLQMIGSIIVLLGLVILSMNFEKEKRHKFKWKPAFYMFLVSLIFATCGIIFKYVTVEGQFWVSSFWEYVGLGVTGILIFLCIPKYRREFIRMNKKGGLKIFSLNISSEVATITGNLLTNYALLIAPVTMVYLVGSFQPAIVLLLTVTSTHLTPHIAMENLTARVLIPKIAAIGIMIAGSVLLFIESV